MSWLTVFTRGPKRLVARMGVGLKEFERGFLAGWRGEGLEAVVKRKLPGIPPERQRELATEMMRKGKVVVPAGEIAITEEDILQTAMAKLPKDFILEDVPWEVKIVKGPSPWGEDWQYKVHFEYMEEFVDPEGVVRQIILDDWLTVTSVEEISRSQAIAQALGVFYMGPDPEDRYARLHGITGILEVHEVRYETPQPTFVGEFLRGFRGD